MKKKKDRTAQFKKAMRNTGCCAAPLLLLCPLTAAACAGWQWAVNICVIADLVCAGAAAFWLTEAIWENPSTWTPIDDL